MGRCGCNARETADSALTMNRHIRSCGLHMESKSRSGQFLPSFPGPQTASSNPLELLFLGYSTASFPNTSARKEGKNLKPLVRVHMDGMPAVSAAGRIRAEEYEPVVVPVAGEGEHNRVSDKAANVCNLRMFKLNSGLETRRWCGIGICH